MICNDRCVAHRYPMKINIICVGENKTPYLLDGEAIYQNRLKRYCQIEMCHVKQESGKKSVKQILKKESERISACNMLEGFVVAVDRKGLQFSTIQLAKELQSWQNRGVQNLIFIIGSAWGLDATVMQKADFVLSLSKLTFQHDMTRLILLEQLYRCFSILKGEKYHK